MLGFLSVPSGERGDKSLVLGEDRRSVLQEVGATLNPYFGGFVPDPYDPNQGNDLVLGRPKEVQLCSQ